MNYAMFQRHTQNAPLHKKIFSEPSGKGHTFPGKNLAGKVFLSKYEMPISVQATVATFQDNFLKMP